MNAILPIMHFLWEITFLRTWSQGLQAKKAFTSVAMPTVPVQVPSQRPFGPSVMSSGLSSNKSDTEMIPEVVHKSPGIYLTYEQNPRKTSAGRSPDEGYTTSHRVKWVPLPPNEVSTIAQHVRKREGRKQGKDGTGFAIITLVEPGSVFSVI